MNYLGIILAGGIGSRMRSEIPKQYLKVMDKEIIEYSIDAFNESKLMEDYIVVTDSEEHMEYVSKKYGVKTILGGSTRNESFQKALDYIRQKGGCKSIFVNEAARPMVTPELIDRFLTLINEVSCVYCVKDVTDSLEHADGTYADRTQYNLVMSPEAYDFQTITRYFSPESKTTFPGHTLPADLKKIQYRDYPENIKVTYPEDLIKLQSLLNARDHNYD